MTTITNDGSDIINKQICTKFISNDMKDIENFELDSTIEWIKQNNFKRVGLQFPDELLPIAVPIVLRLNKNNDCHFGIMADTSYGSCCVDEVGGEHFSIDSLIHYGNACLTPTHRKLPVKYIFGSYKFNDTEIENSIEIIKNHLIANFSDDEDKNVTLLYDFRFMAYGKTIGERLSKFDFCIYNSYPNLSDYVNDSNLINLKIFGSRCVETQNEITTNNVVLFIGDNYDYSVKTTLLSMYHLHRTILMYSPGTNELKDISIEIQRFLRSRLYSIEVAKDAKRVGLLVGTLSIENYLEIYHYLSATMQKSGKTVYPMVVGKINANKLANFADLDVLVVINCTESCLQFSDKRDNYYKPVVTPYEMICACDSTKFSNPYASPYLTDFKDLLKEENKIQTFGQRDDSELSLISGKIVQCSTNGTQDSHSSSASLVSRLDSQWSISAIDRSTRSWFGLDPLLGQTAVAKVKDGRSGIASGYQNEINDLGF